MSNENTQNAPRNPDFDKPLVEMRELLRRAKADNFANIVDDVLNLLRTDPPQAINRLLSVDFWGGSGSLFDLVLCREGGHVSDDYDRDNRTYNGLLLRLLDNMKAEEFWPPCLERTRYILQQWSKLPGFGI